MNNNNIEGRESIVKLIGVIRFRKFKRFKKNSGLFINLKNVIVESRTTIIKIHILIVLCAFTSFTSVRLSENTDNITKKVVINTKKISIDKLKTYRFIKNSRNIRSLRFVRIVLFNNNL